MANGIELYQRNLISDQVVVGMAGRALSMMDKWVLVSWSGPWVVWVGDVERLFAEVK